MPKGNTGAKFSLSVNRQTSIQCNLTLLPPEIHTEYTRPKERLERMPATLSLLWPLESTKIEFLSDF